jgi:hypothetical protein
VIQTVLIASGKPSKAKRGPKPGTLAGRLRIQQEVRDGLKLAGDPIFLYEHEHEIKFGRYQKPLLPTMFKPRRRLR